VGWSWPLETGEMELLARKLVLCIGIDDFYELIWPAPKYALPTRAGRLSLRR